MSEKRNVLLQAVKGGKKDEKFQNKHTTVQKKNQVQVGSKDSSWCSKSEVVTTVSVTLHKGRI